MLLRYTFSFLSLRRTHTFATGEIDDGDGYDDDDACHLQNALLLTNVRSLFTINDPTKNINTP
jgi:hypothetical protein